MAALLYLHPYLAVLPLLISPICSGASPWRTMTTGSHMRGEDHDKVTLLSPDATFSCGFHEVGTNALTFSIWYTPSASASATERTVVWTANPYSAERGQHSPVNKYGSRLSLNRDGNLVLTDTNGSTVWETKTSSGRHTTAALLDSGNLVIRDSSSGSNKVVWQSFRSPTDTLLPGQELTKDTRLVSGYHHLYFDNDNVLRMLYDGPEITSIYWPSPDYNALKNGRNRFNSTRVAVLDDLGTFVSSDGFRIEASDSGPGVKRRITIGYDGNFRMYSLNASTGAWRVTGQAVIQMCYVHGLCGRNGLCDYLGGLRCRCPPDYEMVDPTNWNRGCKPMFLTTDDGKEFTFVEQPHADYYGFDLSSNESVPFEACRDMCLNSSACLSFTYKGGDGWCYTKGLLYNGQVFPYFPGDSYMKVPKSFNSSAAYSSISNQKEALTCGPAGSAELMLGPASMYGTKKDNINWTYLYVFAAVLGALEMLVIATGWYLFFNKHSIPKSMEDGYKLVTNPFRRFTYRELAEATGKFKEELGRGGAGVVYRGVLEDKKVVAVKKLTDVRQGEEEFWAEVTLIGRINHINLVRMWGFCSEGTKRLLVYEYVENESLDKYLFGERSAESLLGWSQRYKIALGTARGLAYLHHECLEWVVHCDVKPENILLTRDFDAKIADFGLAKLAKQGSTSLNFTHMRGTMGYMAPEWALNSPISAKVDVYSYGVVLLEIVTGIRASSGIVLDERQIDFRQFVQEAKHILSTGSVSDIVDDRLQGHFHADQAVAMVKIAFSCLEERRKRPTMDEIVKVLMSCGDDDDYHPAYSY
ncbi:putative receptor protein kinase ZmPK1 [Zea mays]|uniref:Receptor-like serine/threonine-protein kinase n=1 Tax=Zea mays TaxID=4577 RepID=A0A1D6NG97_MAIZE|nr:putative receptor protein kinase ZmPK1 [Zea mays]ONM39461.1 PAN domain-containing protein [Zea mays]|eukprot:XP_008675225.1 putative receptor protein kinase ZmPK1 [Zea mays]